MLFKIILSAAVLLIFVFVYIENKRLDITKITLSSSRLPAAFDGFKIAHLSDTHIKNADGYDENIIKKTKELAPDIIFFTGDLITRNAVSVNKQKEFMRRLKEIAPVFYVFGNHETEADREIRDELLSLEINILNNKKVPVFRHGESITVSGLELSQKYYKNEKGGYRNLPVISKDDIASLIGKADGGFNVLLSHNPKFFDAYAEWGADMVFSGHVHGGAVRINNVGLLSPERTFFPEYYQGVYKKDGASMVVSRGLGKLRLFNHREIILCRLKKDEA